MRLDLNIKKEYCKLTMALSSSRGMSHRELDFNFRVGQYKLVEGDAGLNNGWIPIPPERYTYKEIRLPNNKLFDLESNLRFAHSYLSFLLFFYESSNPLFYILFHVQLREN